MKRHSQCIAVPGRHRLLGGLLAALVAIWVAGCSSGGGGGGGGGGSSSSPTTRIYGGAGSAITLSFTTSDGVSGTFAFSSSPSIGATPNATVDGTYTTYSTGFLELTVTAQTGTPATVGQKLAALELPGTVVFVAPFSGSGSVTALVPTGSCPTSNLDLVWVYSRPKSTWSDAVTEPTFGTFTYNSGTGAALVPAGYNLGAYPAPVGGATPITNFDLGTGTCANGLLSTTDGAAPVDFFLTPSGAALVHIADASDQILTAFPSASGIATTDIGGDYAGISFSDNSGGPQNDPFNVTVTAGATTATISGSVLTDIATGAASSNGALITLSSGSVSCTLTGTVNFGGPSGGGPDTRNIVCSGIIGAGGTSKNVISCAGENPDDQFFSVFMVSK